LILDGHASRLQYELWAYVASKNVDVLVIPSHTSQATQPLDLSVNGTFKGYLQHMQALPKKTKMHSELPLFLSKLIDCIYVSLKPQTIKKGFYNTHLLNAEKNMEKLKEDIDKYLQTLPLICHLGVYILYNIFIYKFKYMY
jgi:hypothetical protein